MVQRICYYILITTSGSYQYTKKEKIQLNVYCNFIFLYDKFMPTLLLYCFIDN